MSYYIPVASLRFHGEKINIHLTIQIGRIRMERRYISDVIDFDRFKHGEFNVIASGCGTGKSYFVAHTLREKLVGVLPQEIVVVTSRSITAEQQSGSGKGLDRYRSYNADIRRFWNKESDDIDAVADIGIKIMCYNSLIDIILDGNKIGYETLSGVKVVVFDECHTFFSDKRFITNMEAVNVWLREASYKKRALLIGLTATPEILLYNEEKWGLPINLLNEDTIPGYRAKSLICTTFESLPALVCGSKLRGKTMIMCRTVEDCFTLQTQIPNSAVLISPFRSGYTDEMRRIRDYIVKNETLPDTFKRERKKRQLDGSPKFDYYPLNVLITTSTAREGFNLLETSGVRNIVSCFTDSMSVTQFAGRARYNLDVLVVAHTPKRLDNFDPDMFSRDQRKAFRDFLANKTNVDWYEGIEAIVEGDASTVRRFILSEGERNFIQYINSKWLLPPGVVGAERDAYRIWRDKDKDEIKKFFIGNRVWNVPPKLVTFNKIISILKNCLGYEVESDRKVLEGSERRYRLIVSFDGERAGSEGHVDADRN